jgi:hypothetical protein
LAGGDGVGATPGDGFATSAELQCSIAFPAMTTLLEEIS